MTDEKTRYIYIYVYREREFLYSPFLSFFSSHFVENFARIFRDSNWRIKLLNGPVPSLSRNYKEKIMKRSFQYFFFDEGIREEKKRKIRDGKEKEEIDSMIDRFPKKDERVSAR